MTELNIYIPDEIAIEPGQLVGEPEIPLLPASKTNFGQFHPDRIPPLDASKIQSGILDEDCIPSSIARNSDVAEALQDIELDVSQIQGTLLESQIPDSIARNSEVDSKIAAALTGSTPQDLTIAAANITGQLSESQLPSSIARDTEMIELLASHVLANGAHPQYSTGLEVTTAVTVGIQAHEVAVDPHPQYRLNSEPVPAASIAHGAIKGYRPSVAVSGNKPLELTDAGTLQRFTAAADLQIPADSTVNFEQDTEIDLLSISSGVVTITPLDGTTINGSTAQRTLTGQWKPAQLKKLSSNAWWLGGEFT